MIQTTCLNSVTRQFLPECSVAAISDMVARPEVIVWTDVSDPTSQDFLDLAEEFGFHPLSIEDCQHGHQRPKIEEFKGYYFIVMYEAHLNSEQDLELRELNMFLGKDFLVTVHSKPIRAIETARRVWPRWIDRAHEGSGLLAYLLIDAMVDDYMPLLDTVSETMDELEDEIFEVFKPESIEKIFYIKKQLLQLRRHVTPLRDVFNTMLRREQPIFARETHIYFHDVFDHTIRVSDTIDTLRDMLASIMDAYLSVSNNRMSMIMKRLTSISTILMSVTLIAGIYGMNFDFMPELHWPFGYAYVLGLILLVAAALTIFLKKVKWL